MGRDLAGGAHIFLVSPQGPGCGTQTNGRNSLGRVDLLALDSKKSQLLGPIISSGGIKQHCMDHGLLPQPNGGWIWAQTRIFEDTAWDSASLGRKRWSGKSPTTLLGHTGPSSSSLTGLGWGFFFSCDVVWWHHSTPVLPVYGSSLDESTHELSKGLQKRLPRHLGDGDGHSPTPPPALAPFVLAKISRTQLE